MLILASIKAMLAVLLILPLATPHYTKATSLSPTQQIAIIRALAPIAKEQVTPAPNFDTEVLAPLRIAQAKAAADALAAQQAAEQATAAQAAQQAAMAAQTRPAPQNAPQGDIQALAQSILAQRGLSGDWGAMNFIINHESGWNLYARNPEGACGLVQALPCSKIVWGDAGSQINWFIDYCIGRYGSIEGAYSHWLAYSWY